MGTWRPSGAPSTALAPRGRPLRDISGRTGHGGARRNGTTGKWRRGLGKTLLPRRHWRTENLQERTLAWLYLLSSFSEKLLYAYQENQGLRTEAQMLTRCFRPASRLVGSLLALATDDKMSPENEYILLKKFQVVDHC